MRRIVGFMLALVLWSGATAEAASLRGSRAAMVQQNQVAKEHGLAFYRTPAEILQAVSEGRLVELSGDENYEVADFVRFPYLQPEVRLFVERLAAQYREACGQKLVVTSAVRPTSGQPANAHQLSVHPAGMAVDLRVSDRQSCRNWLESTLLSLERRGVLNGIREFHPPHYHVAIFPEPYMAYVEERLAAEAATAEREQREGAPATKPEAALTEAVVRELPAAANLVAVPDAGAERSGTPSPLAATLTVMLVLPFGVRLLLRRARRGLAVGEQDS